MSNAAAERINQAMIFKGYPHAVSFRLNREDGSVHFSYNHPYEPGVMANIYSIFSTACILEGYVKFEEVPAERL